MKTKNTLVLMMAASFLAACAGTATQQAAKQPAPAAAAAKPAEAPLTGDALITANIKSALAADPDLKDAKLTVSSADGNVTLKGEIKTLALRRKAEGIVKGVQNVKSVNNLVVVTG